MAEPLFLQEEVGISEEIMTLELEAPRVEGKKWGFYQIMLDGKRYKSKLFSINIADEKLIELARNKKVLQGMRIKCKVRIERHHTRKNSKETCRYTIVEYLEDIESKQGDLFTAS